MECCNLDRLYFYDEDVFVIIGDGEQAGAGSGRPKKRLWQCGQLQIMTLTFHLYVQGAHHYRLWHRLVTIDLLTVSIVSPLICHVPATTCYDDSAAADRD